MFERSADSLLVFQLEVPIRWGDMDAMGHVNNTVYFRYMEQTRISWFEAMGLDSRPEAGEGMVVVNAYCTFARQFEYPGTVLCRHYVGRLGTSSFETYVEMSRTDDPDTVCAYGGAKGVWVDYAQQKSRPLPPQVREAILTPRLG
ncbi:acyl-CoA thioesterase [Quisquiliibacterium transsilvanicum]|uniref:Acyl-CoA thioester hydrolase n=1 Tax=Quisquiliibacterium transsilvanicum TaxID=1549638 RepID=A0A7W8MB26_9BURK|nr:thioesterase family protein [Quisquiliibacterium transsilvanicum]MBB5273719.1 acyl-CoA thioester hydrolase [Quisquiliibacterium transsilvanicum]